MTILVTGGAGYIGSHTVRALVTQGRDVVVLDSLELGHKSRVDNVPFVQGDISDGKIIDKVCRKFDVSEVIHFAAYKAVGESMEQPLRYYNNNVAGTIALVRALMANGVEKIVFSSSAAVYGNPDHVPVTEDAPLRPESVYAETKAIVEKFWHRAKQLACVLYPCATSTQLAQVPMQLLAKTGRCHKIWCHL